MSVLFCKHSVTLVYEVLFGCRMENIELIMLIKKDIIRICAECYGHEGLLNNLNKRWIVFGNLDDTRFQLSSRSTFVPRYSLEGECLEILSYYKYLTFFHFNEKGIPTNV